MWEFVPVLAGGLLGAAFAARAWPRWLRAAAVFLVGVFAAEVSGEWVQNWGFAIVDCGETALAAWVAAVLCRARPWRALFADGRARRRSPVRRFPRGVGQGG
ncbi:MAG: hypothetical protein ACR2FH_05400 [Caulobacteraceae bacterium]